MAPPPKLPLHERWVILFHSQIRTSFYLLFFCNIRKQAKYIWFHFLDNTFKKSFLAVTPPPKLFLHNTWLVLFKLSCTVDILRCIYSKTGKIHLLYLLWRCFLKNCNIAIFFVSVIWKQAKYIWFPYFNIVLTFCLCLHVWRIHQNCFFMTTDKLPIFKSFSCGQNLVVLVVLIRKQPK